MTTRRSVMRAFGKYLDYVVALDLVKRGEIEGSIHEFARAVRMLEYDYQSKVGKLIREDEEDE